MVVRSCERAHAAVWKLVCQAKLFPLLAKRPTNLSKTNAEPQMASMHPRHMQVVSIITYRLRTLATVSQSRTIWPQLRASLPRGPIHQRMYMVVRSCERAHAAVWKLVCQAKLFPLLAKRPTNLSKTNAEPQMASMHPRHMQVVSIITYRLRTLATVSQSRTIWPQLL